MALIEEQGDALTRDHCRLASVPKPGGTEERQVEGERNRQGHRVPLEQVEYDAKTKRHGYGCGSRANQPLRPFAAGELARQFVQLQIQLVDGHVASTVRLRREA